MWHCEGIRLHLWIWSVLICVGIPCVSHAAGDILDCANDDYDEGVLLQHAAGMAARTHKHILTVKYAGGTKSFVNKSPHPNFGGIDWSYCGYNKDTKVFLIGKEKDDLFSGVLLFQETGVVINAGQTVVISPDKRYILAIEQTDGIDGKEWSLLDFSGKKLWHGYAGMTKKMALMGKMADYVYATYENPRWENAFVADFVCSDGSRQGNITLTQVKNTWKWLPEYTCPQVNNP